MSRIFFVFDLDDTLYLERDYSVSALSYLGGKVESELSIFGAAQELVLNFQNGQPDVISAFWEKYNLKSEDKQAFISAMRGHGPEISLFPDSAQFLTKLRSKKIPFAIVTDGRSITQRAKIESLGLTDAIAVAISEETGVSKPHKDAFAPVLQVLDGHKVVFVGDNPAKDFVAPNNFGWDTFQRKDNGLHVHKQVSRNDEGAPDSILNSFAELEFYIQA